MHWLITILLMLVVLIVAFIIFYQLVFLRDPTRQIPPDNVVVSPADGAVAAIIDVTGKKTAEIPKGRWGKIQTLCSDVPDAKYLILVVMNVWHVHVNRAPIRGKITKLNHNKGKFRNAVVSAGDFRTIENENLELVYSGDFTAKTVQIAGLLARRIVSYVKKGDRVLKGQRIGKIIMGSQVALILPNKVKITIKTGAEVKAGSSVIGKW